MVKTLGERIRELREAKDVSLRELARRLDISAAHLSDIELGRRYPSDKLFAKIARTLRTTVGALRDYDTRPPVDELKRMAAKDPAFGLALRRVVNERPEEMKQLMEKLRRHKAGDKEP
jgi:transcriptional regulator with XRE-family HTH domain